MHRSYYTCSIKHFALATVGVIHYPAKANWGNGPGIPGQWSGMMGNVNLFYVN
jgi:hypothetical protein